MLQIVDHIKNLESITARLKRMHLKRWADTHKKKEKKMTTKKKKKKTHNMTQKRRKEKKIT